MPRKKAKKQVKKRSESRRLGRTHEKAKRKSCRQTKRHKSVKLLAERWVNDPDIPLAQKIRALQGSVRIFGDAPEVLRLINSRVILDGAVKRLLTSKELDDVSRGARLVLSAEKEANSARGRELHMLGMAIEAHGAEALLAYQVEQQKTTTGGPRTAEELSAWVDEQPSDEDEEVD